jgi:tetratricopeptide (TPR) repeat protein
LHESHGVKGNYRKAVEDCEECLKINSQNEKAYYRGAKACVEAKRWEKAIEFCEAALKIKPSKSIRLLKEEAEKSLKRQKEIEAEKLEYERQKKQIPKQIMKMLQERGIKVTYIGYC